MSHIFVSNMLVNLVNDVQYWLYFNKTLLYTVHSWYFMAIFFFKIAYKKHS